LPDEIKHAAHHNNDEILVESIVDSDDPHSLVEISVPDFLVTEVKEHFCSKRVHEKIVD
jgi:hypothetical protein